MRRGSSADKRCTVCIAVAADETKLPLFVIFKGAVSLPIANSHQEILPARLYECTQPKGWKDNRVIELWKKKIWKPCVEVITNSALLLDQMESYIHPMFIDAVGEIGTRVIAIPGGFTSLSQPSSH